MIMLLPFLYPYLSYAEYSAEILNLEVGGRACGLGGAYTPISDRTFANWWNPAGILKEDGISAGAVKHGEFGLFDFNCLSIGISRKQLEFGSIANAYVIKNVAAGFTFGTMEIDSIPELPDTAVAQPIGYFGANEQVMLFTIASSIPVGKNFPGQIITGINLKFLRYNIYNTQANGIGLDIGTNYKRNDNLTIGAMIKDLGGTSIKWETNKQDKRQTSIITGIAYQPTPPMLAVVDFGYEYGKVTLRCGAEYTIWDLIALRIGVGNGLSFGIGANPAIPTKWTNNKLKNLNVDYAYSMKELGTGSHLSIILSF